MKERVALYGGTFDPVHLGHLEVARRVSELFEIEKVIFVPAHLAPHKLSREVTSALHRHAMLALATQHDPKLFVSTFELDAMDRRYTVDTVTHFQRALGESVELFFIMGADSWAEITTWREWERLLLMINHVVVTRPGYDVGTAHVNAGIRERVVDVRSTAGKNAASTELDFPRIFITDVVMKDISATELRRAAREGRNETLTEFLPREVAEYLNKYGIYRDSHEAKF